MAIPSPATIEEHETLFTTTLQPFPTVKARLLLVDQDRLKSPRFGLISREGTLSRSY